MILNTAKEITTALESGWPISCEWEQIGSTKIASGQVLACRGDRVLIRHWEDHWYLIGGQGFKLITYPPINTTQ